MIRKILLGCGIASSVLYIALDILGTLRYPGYRYMDQEFSELMAAGSPVRPFMVILSAIPYAVLVMALATGVWTTNGPKRAARTTAALLVGYALTGFVTGTFCPINTREALAAGERGLRNAMHPVRTAVMSLFLLVAMGFGSTLLGRRFRYYSYGTILTLVVFGVLTSLQAAQMTANHPTPWMGLEERVNIYATMLWVATLAVALLRGREELPEAGLGSAPVAPAISHVAARSAQ